MFASVAPREVLARLRRGVAKPQVKLLIGVSDPYRQGMSAGEQHVGRRNGLQKLGRQRAIASLMVLLLARAARTATIDRRAYM
jgi:hypothetical protein